MIGEQLPINDTVTYVVDHRRIPVPVQENFEGLTLPPDGWTTSNGFVTNTHNNISNVLAVNMYSGSQTFTWDTPRFGVISAGDSLYFDYRITNWSAGTDPTILSADTKMEVQVSNDCGANFVTIYTINSLNHVPSVDLKSIRVSLGQFAGSSIVVRFLGTWERATSGSTSTT